MKIPFSEILKTIPRYCREIFVISYYKILSLFFNNKKKFKDAWLICERGIEAKDNGYHFFKYMRENHPEKKVYYLIDFAQKFDYNKIVGLGNLIQYNSFEHKMATFFATYLISTHVGFITPWSFLLYKKFFLGRKKTKFVLLNHGITKEDMSGLLNKWKTGVDLFITANQIDYEEISNYRKYGYRKEEVLLTGYARYDHWYNFETKRQIVFMPTWRKYLVNRYLYKKNTPDIKSEFLQSSYFKHINSFLNNERLKEILDKNNVEFIFYPHYEMQKALSFFNVYNPKIIIATKQTHDIPALLKESSLMISDYSGVGFDFAYMYKPLIYYQFDQEEYYSKHYLLGNFNMEKDGLGYVVTAEKELIDLIENLINNNFQIEEKYVERIDKFFTLHDHHNCERIYNVLKIE